MARYSRLGRPRISIIVPVLDEEGSLRALLDALSAMCRRGCELVVVDGGSGDATRALAASAADRMVDSARGRAVQMNAGAGVAAGDVLWFLHADCLPAADADKAILAALASGRSWGRFDVRLSGRHPLLRVVERAMNLRSALTGIATGDQGIFVQRSAFERAGGFPELALMEDIALSRRLKRLGPGARVQTRVVSSSRRWERDGVLRTILLMWRLRLAYAMGADTRRLARIYYRG